jgi:hypothetical protein
MDERRARLEVQGSTEEAKLGVTLTRCIMCEPGESQVPVGYQISQCPSAVVHVQS